MHERATVAAFVRKAVAVAAEAGAPSVARLGIELGPLSHLTVEGLREAFAAQAAGTAAESAELEVRVLDDMEADHAQDVVLRFVEVEDAS